MQILSRKHSLKVRSENRAHTGLFGRGIDTNEDQFGFEDGIVDISGKEQVSTTGLGDNILEARFIDRELEITRVPRVNTSLVEVDDRDSNMRTFQSYHGTSGSADISSYVKAC